MGLEVAQYISQLDANNPSGADAYSTADDHLRLLKNVLKVQFPNFTAEAVTATPAELNKLAGFGTGGIQNSSQKNQNNGYAGLGADGKLADTLVKASNVTQHQGQLQVNWSQLSGVPSTFTPAAHTHQANEIAGLTGSSVLKMIPQNAPQVIGENASAQAVTDLTYNPASEAGFASGQSFRMDLQLVYSSQVSTGTEIILYLFHKGWLDLRGTMTYSDNNTVLSRRVTGGPNTFFEIHRFSASVVEFTLRLTGLLTPQFSFIDPWPSPWYVGVLNPVGSGNSIQMLPGSYVSYQKRN